jgi:hypothetical protein
MAVVDGHEGFPDAISARVSGRHGADLHCPSAAQQPRFRHLKGPQLRRHSLEGHRPRGRRRGRPEGAHRLRGERPGPQTPPPSAKAGDAPGPRRCRSSPSRAKSGGLSTWADAIEALNAKLRRAVRVRGHFPGDKAATKLLFLVSIRSEKERTMPPRAWSMAKAQVPVIFGERFIKAKRPVCPPYSAAFHGRSSSTRVILPSGMRAKVSASQA